MYSWIDTLRGRTTRVCAICSAYLSIYLFICLFVNLFIYFICLFVFICLFIYIFTYLLHSPHCVVGFLFLLRHLPLLLLLLLLPPPPPTTTTTRTTTTTTTRTRTTTTTTQCGKQRRLNHFQHLRLDLRGRCGTFRTFIYLRKLRDELGRIGAAAFDGDSQV